MSSGTTPISRLVITTLPLEILSLITKHLDSIIDVLHFEQTCKTFDLLVRDSLDIWKHRLRTQCHRDGLWWFSYADLSSIHEIRDACTAGLHMAHAYSRAGPYQQIPFEEKDLELELSNDAINDLEPMPMVNDAHSRGGIQSMSLIPGGRYVLVLYPKWLTVWDLQDTASPLLCLKYPISETCAAFDLLLDGPDRLYVMLENGLLHGEEHYLRCTRQLLEIVYSPSTEPWFSVNERGTIQFIKESQTSVPSAVLQSDRVAFHFSLNDGTGNMFLAVWEYTTKTVAYWTTDVSKEEPMEIIISGDFLLLVTDEGVHVFNIPGFRRVEEWTTIADCQGSLRPPTAFIRHLPGGDTPVTSPKLSNPATLLSYYIIPEGSTNVWHKYNLHLFPDHLAQSYTIHTHTISCSSLDKEHVMYRATGLFDGNIVGDIWEGRREGESRFCAWISMLRWESVELEGDADTVARDSARSSTISHSLASSCDMVPFIPWAKVWSGHGPVSFALCPSSASAVVLWSETDPETATYWFWLRHYSFS